MGSGLKDLSLQNPARFFIREVTGGAALREGLQRKAHSEARARTCSGKPDRPEPGTPKLFLEERGAEF